MLMVVLLCHTDYGQHGWTDILLHAEGTSPGTVLLPRIAIPPVGKRPSTFASLLTGSVPNRVVCSTSTCPDVVLIDLFLCMPSRKIIGIDHALGRVPFDRL